MVTWRKKKTVADFIALLKEVKALVLLDYRGLKTPQITKLREKLKKTGANLKVVKNTLFQISLSSANYPKIPLKGPTSIAFGEDLFSILKLLKEEEIEERIKIGFLEKKTIGKENLLELAEIPSLAYLFALIKSSLEAPIYLLVSLLATNLDQLILTLSKIKKGGEKDG